MCNGTGRKDSVTFGIRHVSTKELQVFGQQIIDTRIVFCNMSFKSSFECQKRN